MRNVINEIFTKRNIIYTVKAYIAITLALGISLSLNLDKPMWAIIAALFLQFRPETGFIIEKALLLIIVSFIGVMIGFLIVDLFLQYPVLALFCLCIFITVSIFFSANMSHPNLIYALTLANITCAIIVFYSIANPIYTTSESIFHTGYSRVTEIMIGSLCSCLVNYYIFPIKIENTLQDHVTTIFDLTISYMKDILSAKNFSNNEAYNKHVENILNSLVTLDNDLSASKYENIDNKKYILYSNKVVELIQIAHLLRKQTIKDKSYKKIKKELNDLKLSSFKKMNSRSDNPMIAKLINNLDSILDSYKGIKLRKLPKLSSNNYYRFKNYNNPAVTFIAASRSILLLIGMYLFWINTQGSSSLLMMIILPCVLSQVFVAAPDPAKMIKQLIIGMMISVPISIFVTLNLLAEVIGYFELMVVVFLGTLTLAIMTLTHPKFQIYSLGFCLGVICIVQPSNHMNFEIAKSITVGLSTIVGCAGLWLSFKLYPHSPYTISRIFAINSIIKDIKKLNNKEISRQYYQATVIKKILSIYKNRKNDDSSEIHIEFALQSLAIYSDVKFPK